MVSYVPMDHQLTNTFYWSDGTFVCIMRSLFDAHVTMFVFLRNGNVRAAIPLPLGSS